MAATALRVLAGPRARAVLRERGLRPADVQAIVAAAGGPKGLVFNPLDRLIFGSWLDASAQPVQLLGASIGAWRLASACQPDAARALERMAHAYVTQRYSHAPGRAPAPDHVSRVLGATLAAQFAPDAQAVVAHPRYRLQVFTSRGLGLLGRSGRWRTPLGFAAASAANALGRRHLARLLERVVVGRPEQAPPLHDYPASRHLALTSANLVPALLASCSIPIWLDPVVALPGGPPGPYWDGGVTDYHLRLDYARWLDALVLVPHFQPTLVPGWLDKAFARRHRPDAGLDNVVMLVPSAQWIATLPGARLPDRQDFRTYADDPDQREARWRQALAESERLADAFEQLTRRPSLEAEPLDPARTRA